MVPVIVTAVAVLALGLKPATAAQVSYYDVTQGAHPHDVAPAPDGKVWYTEYGNGVVGRLSGGPLSTAQEFTAGGGHHGPSGLATGNDRQLWLAMDGAASTLERFDTVAHTVKSYTLPTTGGSAYEIITGPDGNLWYTTQANRIGRLELPLS